MSTHAVWLLFLVAFSVCLLPSAGTRSSILLPSQLALGSPSSCRAPDPNLYYQPVIGIVSHPGDSADGRLSNATGVSYIAASYVKFVEAAGARVVPLIYTEPPEKLLKKLELVNGVLFTGGTANSGLYFDTVTKIFKINLFPDAEECFVDTCTFSILEPYASKLSFSVQKTLEKNDAGDHFPLYAVCLGFELITMIVSQVSFFSQEEMSADKSGTCYLLVQYTIITVSLSLSCRFPPELLRKMTTDCLVMQNHHLGISPGKFLGSRKLSRFFEILTTSTDDFDKVYVSTISSRNYPVTGFQWHPEKNAFEWGSPRIPHTEDAIQITQHAANFLVRLNEFSRVVARAVQKQNEAIFAYYLYCEARKSLNRPVTQEVLENLIYNYSPTYSGKAGEGFDEVYLFSQV
ncbi:hypothetical protein V8G54_025596 [Vigna mungo]|uniref:folate gamma-glutamyl hydrolase n=1 Tax=Vigna mungo TaxID=3915 RepID=A0AAQ3MYW4_VIGMU